MNSPTARTARFIFLKLEHLSEVPRGDYLRSAGSETKDDDSESRSFIETTHKKMWKFAGHVENSISAFEENHWATFFFANCGMLKLERFQI